MLTYTTHLLILLDILHQEEQSPFLCELCTLELFVFSCLSFQVLFGLFFQKMTHKFISPVEKCNNHLNLARPLVLREVLILFFDFE